MLGLPLVIAGEPRSLGSRHRRTTEATLTLQPQPNQIKGQNQHPLFGRDVSGWLPRRKHDLRPQTAPSFPDSPDGSVRCLAAGGENTLTNL